MLLPFFLNYSIIFHNYHQIFKDCYIYFAEKSDSTFIKVNIIVFCFL